MCNDNDINDININNEILIMCVYVMCDNMCIINNNVCNMCVYINV